MRLLQAYFWSSDGPKGSQDQAQITFMSETHLVLTMCHEGGKQKEQIHDLVILA